MFYKQIPNGQYCHVCVKCVIWKQIYEKCELVITDSWLTFSNGGSLIMLARPTQSPSAIEWPHYITINLPRVGPQNAHKRQDKQNMLTSNSSLETICIKPRFWVSINHVWYMYHRGGSRIRSWGWRKWIGKSEKRGVGCINIFEILLL